MALLQGGGVMPEEEEEEEGEATVPMVQTVGLAGGSSVLPCDTSSPGGSDSNPPTLVIWYKNEGDPIYR